MPSSINRECIIWSSLKFFVSYNRKMMLIFILLTLSLMIFSFPALLIVKRYIALSVSLSPIPIHVLNNKKSLFRLHKKKYYASPFNRHYAFDLTVTGLLNISKIISSYTFYIFSSSVSILCLFIYSHMFGKIWDRILLCYNCFNSQTLGISLTPLNVFDIHNVKVKLYLFAWSNT